MTKTWREHLTPAELIRVRALERAKKRNDSQSVALHLIRNRAAQRKRYARKMKVEKK